MLKKTDPQQSLLGVDTLLSEGPGTRLSASWAHLFKVEILPFTGAITAIIGGSIGVVIDTYAIWPKGTPGFTYLLQPNEP